MVLSLPRPYISTNTLDYLPTPPDRSNIKCPLENYYVNIKKILKIK